MTLEKLRDFHRASPFRPFEIYLADGRVLQASHPEFLFVGGRTFTVFEDPDIGEVVDLLLVTSLKPIKPLSSPHNGH